MNVVVFLSYWLVLPNDLALARFFYQWGLVPAISEPTTFVASMFLHGGFMHLAGNMLFLWVFGDNMEDAFGHVGFLIFYLACGLAADGLQIIAEPWSPIPVVGASGAIAGVLGGYLLLYPKARVDIVIIFIVFFKTFTLRAWIVLAAWFAFQIFGGLSSPTDEGGVAYWAHTGGFVAGVFLALPWFLRNGGQRFWDRTEGHPPHPETQTPRLSRVPTVKRRR